MTRSSRDEDRSKDHRDENPARLIQEMLRDLAALSHAQARLSYRLLRLAERLQDSTIQPGSRVVAETGAAGPTMAAAGSGRDAEAQPGIADRETREALQETTSGAEEQAPASAVEANEPAMPQPAAQPVPGSESETKTKTEPDTEPATQQEPDTQQRPQPEPQPEPEPAAESTAPRNGGRPEVKAASPEPVILEIEAGAETEIEAGLETGIATAAPASVSETPAAEAVRSDVPASDAPASDAPAGEAPAPEAPAPALEASGPASAAEEAGEEEEGEEGASEDATVLVLESKGAKVAVLWDQVQKIGSLTAADVPARIETEHGDLELLSLGQLLHGRCGGENYFVVLAQEGEQVAVACERMLGLGQLANLARQQEGGRIEVLRVPVLKAFGRPADPTGRSSGGPAEAAEDRPLPADEERDRKGPLRALVAVRYLPARVAICRHLRGRGWQVGEAAGLEAATVSLDLGRWDVFFLEPSPNGSGDETEATLLRRAGEHCIPIVRVGSRLSGMPSQEGPFLMFPFAESEIDRILAGLGESAGV